MVLVMHSMIEQIARFDTGHCNFVLLALVLSELTIDPSADQ